jgi:hypothetical protein
MYLAILNNSKIIEIYDDKSQISYSFLGLSIVGIYSSYSNLFKSIHLYEQWAEPFSDSAFFQMNVSGLSRLEYTSKTKRKALIPIDVILYC